MDWLDDLREFDSAIVGEACGRWRRSETRRPAIADIVRLCHEEQVASEARERRALPLPDHARLAELRDEHCRMRRAKDEDAARHREQWARQLGYQSFRQMLDIGLVAAVRDAPAYR